MSDCCSQPCTNEEIPKKLACPINQIDYVRVPLKTLLHHVKEPWKYNLKDQGYYFCDAADCDVAYFAKGGLIIKKSELRTPVSEQEKYQEKMICFCFGVSLADAKRNPAIKAFVMQHTKLGNCACEARNPSGHCCLKNFP